MSALRTECWKWRTLGSGIAGRLRLAARDPLPYQVLKHGDYVEVRLEGALDDALDFDAPDLSTEIGAARLLLDYSGVTEIHASAYTLAEQARNGELRGLKVAVCAPRPALFGLSRQAFQLSHIREGESAGVFSDLETARAWLTSA